MGGPSMPMIASLYVSQYLGIGFLYFGIGAIFRNAGLDLEQIGTVALLGLIWVAKAFWAPLIDHVGRGRLGHYRTWLLALCPLMVISLAALAPFDDVVAQQNTILALMAVFITVSATQDIATDAVVSRYVEPDRQGPAHGAAGAGQWLGNIAGGGLLLMVYERFGWTAAIASLALLTLAPLPLIMLWREPQPAETPRRATLTERYRGLVGSLSNASTRRWTLGCLPLFWGSGTALYALLSVALTDAGWSLSSIALLLGVVTAVPGITGALSAGWMLRRFPTHRVIGWVGYGTAVASCGLIPAFTAAQNAIAVGAGVCLYVMGMSAITTTVYRVHVTMTRPGHEGTDFTVISSLGMVGTALAGYAVFWVAAAAGYVGALGCFALLGVLGTFLAARHVKHRHRAPRDPLTPSSSVLGPSGALQETL